jgi:hypothetical protein
MKDKILSDMKDAMKARDKSRVMAIRLLRASIQRREIDERIDLDDAGVLSVIQKMIKQGKDSIEQFEKGNRQDLVNKENVTLLVLEDYLPKQLTDVEIELLLDDAFDETGAETIKEMGKVMGWLKPKLQGKADMGSVSAKIKQRLM